MKKKLKQAAGAAQSVARNAAEVANLTKQLKSSPGVWSSLGVPPAAIALALYVAPEFGLEDPMLLVMGGAALASWLTSLWSKQEGRDDESRKALR